MRKVIADQSMSLDGFSTGPNVIVGNFLGDGGERLHDWMFRDEGPTGRDAQVRDELFKTSGAVSAEPVMIDARSRGQTCGARATRHRRDGRGLTPRRRR